MVRVPRQLSLVITKINDCALEIPGNQPAFLTCQLFSLAPTFFYTSHCYNHDILDYYTQPKYKFDTELTVL